jgi:putative transposase
MGRPGLPADIRQLIVRMVKENPAWGQERIAAELWLKLGVQVSPRTVRAYWPQECDPRNGKKTARLDFLRSTGVFTVSYKIGDSNDRQ